MYIVHFTMFIYIRVYVMHATYRMSLLQCGTVVNTTSKKIYKMLDKIYKINENPKHYEARV